MKVINFEEKRRWTDECWIVINDSFKDEILEITDQFIREYKKDEEERPKRSRISNTKYLKLDKTVEEAEEFKKRLENLTDKEILNGSGKIPNKEVLKEILKATKARDLKRRIAKRLIEIKKRVNTNKG